MNKLFGPQGALLIATAFLLAACAGEKEAPVTVTEPTETAGGASNGQPDAVTNEGVTEDSLGGNPFGAASQDGLANFSGDRVYFAYDSSELTSEARADLQRQAEWLKHFSNVRVVVEGHCDERGTREYNLALGERRAIAVKNYLIGLGIGASRMSTISYGKERPAVVGNGEQSYRLNRRGVLIVQ